MAKQKRDHNKEIEAFQQPSFDPMQNLFTPTQNGGNVAETEHLKEIVRQAYSKKDIQLKSDLTARQIDILTRMSLYQQLFKSQVMAKMTNTFMQLRVSHKRLGRKEFVQVAQSFTPQPTVEPSPIKRRLFGE
jgi:uncharacterized protein with von Willebrand factor type A (vWA) domain